MTLPRSPIRWSRRAAARRGVPRPRYCTGFSRVLPYLTGESDGQPKDAAWAERITGVKAETIRTLARDMARQRTMLTASWSLQRADHGEQAYWALVLLACCLGQIGLPGGGFGFGYGSSAAIAEPPNAFPGPALPTIPNPARMAIPAARIADCLLSPGKPYDYDGKPAVYPDIRLVYWAGGNPFHHHQDLNRLRRAWQRPETIVVHEPWWTATARQADIVLPATTSPKAQATSAAPRATASLSRCTPGDRPGRRRPAPISTSSARWPAASAARKPSRKAATRATGSATSTRRSASARRATPCPISRRSGKKAGSRSRRRATNT